MNYKLHLGFLLLFACALPAVAQEAATKPATAPSKYAIPASDEGLPGAGPIRRYDWFQDLWQRKRSGWAQRVAQDQEAVVFLGDSITQGWGDDLMGSFPGLKIANRGISGDTTRGMLIRLKEDVLALHPRGIVLLMGTNDLEEGADPTTIASNFQLIINELKQYSADMPITVCQVFPSSASKSRPTEKIKSVNALYAAAVQGDPQVTLLDTWTLFADPEGNAKALRPILATQGFIETQADAFVIEAGFESLFNGHDLSGWCLLPTTEKQLEQLKRWQGRDPAAPAWPIVTEKIDLAGKTQTPDGRYVALNGRLIVTTPPEGRKIQQLWTTREFPNDFTLKLEFRATPNADSGVFLREPQLQCRDFPLAGPYKDLKAFRAGDWNELVVKVTGNVAYCTCNGELLEAEFKLPATGPIGLEGDRGQMEYRRIRIGPNSTPH